VAAVEAAAKLCKSLGHKVEEASPAVDQDSMFEPFMALWTSGLTMQVDYIAALTGQKPGLDNLEGLTLGLYEAGKRVTAAQYQMALLRIQQVTREVARWHVKYDVWITPTLGKPPLAIGEFDIDEGDVEKGFAPMLDYVPFTALQNGTGQPAINLPLYWNAGGLPIGTQFVGRVGEEALLLQLATQIEAAQPWDHRFPAKG
jgi:amidase